MTKSLPPHIYDKKIDQFFAKTKNVLGNDFNFMLKEFEIPDRRVKFSKIPLTKMVRLLESLNVSLDSVMKNEIDYECLKVQYYGNDHLPEKFLNKLPYSSRFTTMYMLNYIAQHFGEKSAETIMKHFQLKKAHLQNSSEFNNYLLPMGVGKYVYEYFGHEAAEEMGRSSIEILTQTPAGQQLKCSPTVIQMFELFFEEIAPSSVEKNYLWNVLKQENGRITVLGRPNPEVQEAFHNDKSLTCESSQLLRKGFLSAMPSLIGDYKVSVEMERKIHQGKLCDLYHITYLKEKLLKPLFS